MKDIDIKLELMKTCIDIIYVNARSDTLHLTRKAVQNLLTQFKQDLLDVYEIGKRDALTK